MSRRRGLLLGGVALLVASAARPGVATETEVEGAGYTGSTAGGWICGPVGRARYNGVGVGMAIRERPNDDDEGSGLTGRIGFAAEHESVEILADTCDDCSNEELAGPPDHWMFAGRGRGGYRGRYFGMEGGFVMLQAWEDPDDQTPASGIVPEIAVTIARYRPVHAILGVGAPLITTLRRPGGYAGVVVPADGWMLEAVAGAYRGGPTMFDDLVMRGDLVLKLDVTQEVALRFGGSLSGNDKAPAGAEASAGMVARF